ncbi:30S ribosomal protein S4 [Candidatus Aquarickettsia rohweri]|uniref:Small ribosomal subunit protein uS4 n=1 Tax=Candidatus Aquarickettsia rohweri TaxID=2602574 RepID=A0A3R9XUK0_9RICK|nr:30S ribosomal protein S4 [Candidatus Aquarickettsia rohweri]RST66223.1 30S ribosomal protein S4 [Candidatus Aquarickettsia rohweri]
MSKRLNRKYGISRRIGAALWGSEKDPCHKKNYPPGVHGVTGYKKTTEYGTQLIAKQKLKKYYGDIRERQFKSIYKEASRRKGDTGENLIGLLESRLDAFVYRSKFVSTMFSSRQFITHKHVKVNGKVVNIPSYVLKINDVVEVKEASKKLVIVFEAKERNDRDVPEYIKADNSKLQATFLKMPALSEVPYPIQMEPSLVVEFYSR